jgi:tRNA A-37 threonylcarbamoyl transferase component Bud32
VTIRIRKIAPEEAPRREEWARALAEFEPAGATPLKQDSGGGVYCKTMLDEDVVVKVWRHRSVGPRMKAALRQSPAERHWRNAAWLRQHGIATAQPLVLAIDHSRASIVLIMKRVVGRTLLEHLAEGLPPKREWPMARAVGRMLHRLEAAGRYNRDSKPSNLMVLRPDDPTPEIAIIDCVAIRRLPPLWWAPLRIAKMHSSLILEPTGCGCPPRRTQILRVLVAKLEAAGAVLDRKFWRDNWVKEWLGGEWNEAGAIIQSHGDPTPKVNPLPGGGRVALGEDLR